ncbi:MAG: ABC transporter permease [Alicyclobacillus herbarius]|uniref:ABC transporter permease n=1 Tax=Alicyclobacillus herbarius TaxID=122960 RepID=UPI0023557DAA|nr:ABC transporter permease [Alicyclobacillus herbarius]MCL6632175.1 ABC transporter permease [Alicyclobacillus herbarius]
MWSSVAVLREHLGNLYLIRRLSSFEFKTEHMNAYLGVLWEVINPLIQIGIYWFVFGIGIRRGHSVDDVPYFVWMLSGMVAWFFFNAALGQGTRALHSRLQTVARMSFPISVVPTFVIVKNLYQHWILLGIVLVIFTATGHALTLYVLQLVYFMFSLVMLLVSLSLLTATLATVVRDVQQIVQSILRVLLYFTPLLWPSDRLPGLLHKVMLLNPLDYVVEGYRAALLGTSWYPVMHWKYTLYFWLFVAVVFMLGAKVHMQFRHRLMDYV